jgi:hypothetical protein
MFVTILNLLEAGLSLWASKEARKYIDRKNELEKKYRAEVSKPRPEQSDAVMDNLNFELQQLAEAFILESKK